MEGFADQRQLAVALLRFVLGAVSRQVQHVERVVDMHFSRYRACPACSVSPKERRAGQWPTRARVQRECGPLGFVFFQGMRE